MDWYLCCPKICTSQPPLLVDIENKDLDKSVLFLASAAQKLHQLNNSFLNGNVEAHSVAVAS